MSATKKSTHGKKSADILKQRANYGVGYKSNRPMVDHENFFSFHNDRPNSNCLPDPTHISSRSKNIMSKRNSEGHLKLHYRKTSRTRGRTSPKVTPTGMYSGDTRRSYGSRGVLDTIDHERKEFEDNMHFLKDICLKPQKFEMDLRYKNSDICISLKLWEKVKSSVWAIQELFKSIIDQKLLEVQSRVAKDVANHYKEQINSLTQENTKLMRLSKNYKIKYYKLDEKGHDQYKQTMKLYDQRISKLENEKIALKHMLDKMSKNFQKFKQEAHQEEEEIDIDPEFDSKLANYLNLVQHRQQEKKEKKKSGHPRNRSEISESSLNKSHSLGDFLEKSSQEAPPNEEEQKKLFPYHENEGGPIENYDEDAKSAEWMSELESDSFSVDIRTEDIKEHFPECFEQIEAADTLKQVALKQMYKLEIAKEVKKTQAALKPSNSEEKKQDDIIKVFSYENDDQELSKTTPRNDFQASIERNEAVGDQTIKEHTFEDVNLSQSSINSQFFSKESFTDEERKESSQFSSNYLNSNEKRSDPRSDIKSARVHNGGKLNSDRSHDRKDDHKKEKGIIHVIGRDMNKVPVPKISLSKASAFDRNCDNEQDNIPRSNRSNSNRSKDKSKDIKYKNLQVPNLQRNNEAETPYTNKFAAGDSESGKNDNFNNCKIGKDLEVIKENHSEFSNSNSVIETFRNKRKSNISSSGNNSGDQNNIRGAQEMINEEDEEDIENDTTSFRGPKKLNPYQETPVEEEKNDQSQNENSHNAEDFSKSTTNKKSINYFTKNSLLSSNKGVENKDFSPCDNYNFNRPVNLHLVEMNNKFMRSSSMSPNTRLLRSFSSEIPSYILQYKEKISMENEEESVIYGQGSQVGHYKGGKLSPKNNNDNLKEFTADVDDNRFEREMTDNEHQFMKSPSMGSIRMDNKEKTAEFEGEDLSQNQPSEKKNKPVSLNVYFGKNNVNNSMMKEEQKVVLKKEDLINLKNLQLSQPWQKVSSKFISSSIISDSNGTYKLLNQGNSLPFFPAQKIFQSQTIKSYIKGQEDFESEGGIKNSSFINCNEYYPEFMNRMFKRLNHGDKTGQYTYTSVSGIVEGDIASFIKNELAINDKNNFIHTPSAGVLFCSSMEANKVHTSSDWHKGLNPTSKIGRLNNFQSSKGSEATTSKAMTKYLRPLKLKIAKS